MALKNLAVFLLVVLLAAAPAVGREKSDAVTLKNGNRVNGEILHLVAGWLTLKTDSMGSVDIKWEDVASVTSRFQFRIEDSGGRLYYGSLEAPPEAGTVRVAGPGFSEQLTLLSVVRMHPFDQRLWDRFSGSLTLGYSFTKANTTTQYNAATDIHYRSSRYEGAVSYNSVLSRYNGVTQADMWKTNVGGLYVLGNKWFVFGNGILDHNSELDLDRRTSLLGGVGRFLVQNYRSNLRIGGGFNYSRENYTAEPGRNNAEGVLAVGASIYKLKSPKVDVQTEYLLIPSLSDAGRVRMQLNVGANLELFVSDFFWNVSFYESFDSRPPKEISSRNDYGIVTGISWSFRK